MSDMIVLVIIFAVLFTVLMAGILYCTHNGIKSLGHFAIIWGVFSFLWALAFTVIILVFTSMKPSATIPETEVEPNVYFVYAEKTSEKDGVVTFVTMNLKNNQFYTWISEYGTEFPDVPYILTMDSKGTATLKDDEILVVWANNN